MVRYKGDCPMSIAAAAVVLTIRRSTAVVPIGMCPGVAGSIALQLLMLTVSSFIAVDVTVVLTVRRSIAVAATAVLTVSRFIAVDVTVVLTVGGP